MLHWFRAELLYRYLGNRIVIVVRFDEKRRLHVLGGRQHERIAESGVVVDNVLGGRPYRIDADWMQAEIEKLAAT